MAKTGESAIKSYNGKIWGNIAIKSYNGKNWGKCNKKLQWQNLRKECN